jgi:two-component system phosphate regulon sensor histidine kinase PhoR
MKQMHPQFKQKRIHIDISLEEGLPSISADSQKIAQVYANILSNALKFTPAEGTVQISVVSSKDAAGASEFMQTSISNNGPGILPNELPTLFERYKQGIASEIVQAKGTGLGLAICKLIVEAHGGIITAESEPGKITTFRFSLPVSAPAGS